MEQLNQECLDGKELTVVDVYEAVGAYDAGKLSLEDLKNIENVLHVQMQDLVEGCLLQTQWHQFLKQLVWHYQEVPVPPAEDDRRGINGI